ncbi:type I restriction endonuclease subunit R [Deinococcus radiophilus]|uniref:Type I restriction endonuclease subunit R n=2 Tax=Deinococcus radiophilus TaxID=32062 RepID=A0A3S0K692_9DEIO|nr:type I restriction endonuclease subunit R [Deinococcus radiophilus]RTR22360.1 type I restriction endonuclease subunit R [Deinococcus radiophilus]
MPTDTSEKALETIIVNSLTSGGWLAGSPQAYEREYQVDLVQLTAFLEATQPGLVDAFDLHNASPTRHKFLSRLQGEITKRGIVDVLRNGINHGPHSVDLFYGTPTPGNTAAEERYAQNRFTVTRQLRYSNNETALALDLGLFVNGLPIATLELKNSLTKQTVGDAIEQYKRDRDPRERLFELGRCIAHFAVDDSEVYFCTQLAGKASWFLPFNRGWNQGGGNPPNPNGLKTAYFWEEVLHPQSLTNILENYAQVVEEENPKKPGKKKRKAIFPRYHQLDAVRKLLADVQARGAGQRYLIQHSAGSGKSNSIAWLAHQLVGLQRDGQPVFDSVVVVTDRRILDKQIRDTIRQFAQVKSTVGHAVHSGDLRTFLQSGKKIIITTVQKFPFILDEISLEQGKSFAILIDEAHSSQSGRSAAAMNQAMSGDHLPAASADEGEQDTEDWINEALDKRMQSRKMLKNASYFAFTATPKNRTLETFGTPVQQQGQVQHLPFHVYSMKQATQEGFIMDVLKSYTPVQSYYRLVKKVEADPEFDAKRAQKKLRNYVEGHQHAIRTKAEIMVDHFHEQVIAQQKVGGEARAMIVTGSIQRAIEYFHAVRDYLSERKSPYKAIVAFSGEPEYGGVKVTEASLNGFPSQDIPDRIQEDPYRFLICADKFQTGYDEPLLHTMYVDKPLSGIKAVQTLSRLNRAHPKKHDVFVLDFQNDTEVIQKSFEPYYRTTVLSDETDPNKLHDLKSDLDGMQVYSPEQVDALVELYLSGAQRDRLDPILDACVADYNELDEEQQVEFKGNAKSFVRIYSFLAALLPYSDAAWEKLSIFLNFLIPKLPAPKEEDLSRGILETIDMDSYRAEKQAMQHIALTDKDGTVDPTPGAGVLGKAEAELDTLSHILKAFNDQFGNIQWSDKDKLHKLITEEIPARVAEDIAYQNAMRNSSKQNARIEGNKALGRVLVALMKDNTELFKQYSDNGSFQKWMQDMVFDLTYNENQRGL